ncbi:hypothetical protein KVR01_007201 [Diaporthe batatas]|uniref:uncharacterized protein n=1 Tax=Diaporthe batatas TaxID=748121 RepID=UPI001D052BF8|nr:uncharacterized protein KVR01_007201 [Diaporthe batatas]KAG8162723.1 hypothetical protein KVR01_007201 [Diaporthe batatas]
MLKLLIRHILWAVMFGEASHASHHTKSIRPRSILTKECPPQVLSTIQPPLPQYRVQDLQWEVPISADGRTAVLNGTVQEVYRQVLRLNPRHGDEFGTPHHHKTSSRPRTKSQQQSQDMARRGRSACGRFDPARERAVWEGIRHLAHVAGRPVSVPGPGVCGRMFTEKTLSSFSEIGASVQVLIGNCGYWSDEGSEPHVSGSQAHVDKWRTIVREAAC